MNTAEINALAEAPEMDQVRSSAAGVWDALDGGTLPEAMLHDDGLGWVEARSEQQRRWAARPLAARLAVLAKARIIMAQYAEHFAEAISPALSRTKAETLVAEVLPLLDACRFLEREAPRLLRTRKLRRQGRPFWLRGVVAEIRREPLGRVLVIGPANFPLFLPGVQTLQALAAGNAVIWKPGAGGEPVAQLFARCLSEAGLPAGVLHITGEDVAFAEEAIAAVPNKVVFTGSSHTGRKLLQQLAPRLIPATLELSGTDAVIVLASADLAKVAKAVAFALRLNGGEVCMSPRRLLATAKTMNALRPLLIEALQSVPPVVLSERIASTLEAELHAAEQEGARLLGVFSPKAQQPLLLDAATASMSLTQNSFFAPVLALMEVPSDEDSAAVHNRSPYGLTVSIFGDERAALALAPQLKAGSVLINDIIAPTADPRLPFGGRGESGYGVTRGAEGLLEMTAIKVVQVRRNRSVRHYEPTTEGDVALFAGTIRAAHAASWRQRLSALAEIVRAARTRKTSSNKSEPR